MNVLQQLKDNEKIIFNYLRREGQGTKLSISQQLNLPLTSLNRLMKSLSGLKLISTVGMIESSGGRPATVYEVHGSSYYIGGVDLSRTYTKIVICNLKMEVVFQSEFQMTKAETPSVTLEKIKGHFIKGIEGLNIEYQSVLGIGIGTIGPLDLETGVIYNPNNFLSSGWKMIALRDQLESVMGMQVWLDNGTNTGCLAEYYYGIGKTYDNMAYFNCGIGIRSAQISDNYLLRKKENHEDAFGHMMVTQNGRKCSCGNLGCLESYASIPSILRIYEEKTGELLDFEGFLSRVSGGDSRAIQIFDESSDILATGLANYIKLLDPQLVILTGPIMLQSILFYEECKVKVDRLRGSTMSKVVFFNQGYYKMWSMAVGGAVMVYEKSLGMHYRYVKETI